MKKWLLFFGVFSYLFFLVLRLPATYLLEKFGPLPRQIEAYGVEGSVFQGRAALVQWREWRFESVTWNFQPLTLVTGRAEFSVVFRGLEGEGHTQIGVSLSQESYLKDTHVRIRVSALEPLWRPMVLSLEGWVLIDLEHASWKTEHLDLLGKVTLENTIWDSKPPLSFGSYLVALDTVQENAMPVQPPEKTKSAEKNSKTQEPSEPAIRGQITDINGPVQIKGQLLAYLKSKTWQITTSFWARPQTPEQIKNLLSLLGAPNREGHYSWSSRGQLPSDF
ncbi:general secretion pathway protein N [Gammaproteobacteria bacterium]